MDTTTPTDTLIRLPEVMALTGLSRTSIYRRVKDKTFPKSCPLSESEARSAPIAWSLAEVKDWIEERKNARTAEKVA
ncbi:AlpA family transcriptional regulator [Pseudomonas sp. LjRoot71]|jgi:prophage regulatory protein|uniref:helix-turn-helix transcriptional regulator n=1 Tax=unclassified Pseudomonas TaxID=196821 RepID=UPI00141E385B|nr:AlpA family transcriptional regulator [Pseudomonas sp. OTU750018]